MEACLTADELQDLIRPLACRFSNPDGDLSLHDVVTEILNGAQSFVPSEAGSLLMSHPTEDGALVFVASFGEGSDKLPGTVLPAGRGISGQVYHSGEPFMTNSPEEVSHHYRGIDKLTHLQTKSLLSVPLMAYGESVGVLNLLNRCGGKFQQQDLDLLKIFSRYLTQSIQIVFEAKRQKENALRDHLSGLYNDRFLYSCLVNTLATAKAENRDVGLIFLDLDHFKAVVDTHGHLVGSQALRECGHLIGKVADSFDGIPARYGGDEYVVVVPRASKEKMDQLSEALRHELEHAVLVCEDEGKKPVILDRRVTASVGVVCLSQLKWDDEPVTQIRQHMIRMADVAMYEAKARGKNCVQWHDPVHLKSDCFRH